VGVSSAGGAARPTAVNGASLVTPLVLLSFFTAIGLGGRCVCASRFSRNTTFALCLTTTRIWLVAGSLAR